MTIQDWGAIGEAAGALLVGVTLIFFAIQLRQTSRSVETSALTGWLAARIAINQTFFELDTATLQQGMGDSRALTGENAHKFGLSARSPST